MNPNICARCKHWSQLKLQAFIDISVDARCCQHWMVCQPSYGTRDNRTMTNNGVYTCDEGGYTGELITGPNFGCIHFEQDCM